MLLVSILLHFLDFLISVVNILHYKIFMLYKYTVHYFLLLHVFLYAGYHAHTAWCVPYLSKANTVLNIWVVCVYRSISMYFHCWLHYSNYSFLDIFPSVVIGCLCFSLFFTYPGMQYNYRMWSVEWKPIVCGLILCPFLLSWPIQAIKMLLELWS